MARKRRAPQMRQTDPSADTALSPVAPSAGAVDVRTAEPKGPRSKLTGEDMLLMARLSRAGRSSREIAAILSTPERRFSEQAVAAWLARVKTSTEDVYTALAGLRARAVESWDQAMLRGARDGRHAPAKDLLQATGVIQATPAAAVTVIIGAGPLQPPTLPDLPAHARVLTDQDTQP